MRRGPRDAGLLRANADPDAGGYDLGWSELNDPASMVELAIVLEELGHATDPTPFLATMSQFAPLAAGLFDPHESGTAVHNGVSAHRDADGWVLDGKAGEVPVRFRESVLLARIKPSASRRDYNAEATL